MFSARVLAIVVATTGPVWAGVFPAGEMHDQVANACTQCHSGDVVTSQRKSRGDWADTVGQMVANGANVPEASFDKVVDYLAKNFPSPSAKSVPQASTAVAIPKAGPTVSAATKPSIKKRTLTVKPKPKRSRPS